MKNRIEQHLNNLRQFGLKSTYDKLQQLELRAHNIALDSCNGYIEEEDLDSQRGTVMAMLSDCFIGGRLPDGVFFNGDPRGFALKIEPECVPAYWTEKDWGGYGILSIGLEA